MKFLKKNPDIFLGNFYTPLLNLCLLYFYHHSITKGYVWLLYLRYPAQPSDIVFLREYSVSIVQDVITLSIIDWLIGSIWST